MIVFRVWCLAALWLVVLPMVHAAEDAGKTITLVNFEQSSAFGLHANQAQSKLVEANSGRALEITTDAAADYPAVLIQSNAGAWDLRGYDAVEMDVQNLEDAPLRVLLSIQNPGADGRSHCNVESLRLPPNESGVLTVPFGVWHGEKNHPLDQSQIVGLQVLLDKPGRAHRFVVDNLRAVRYERWDLAKVEANPFFQGLKPAFGRGVNLGNALDGPKEGEWGVTLEESYFELIKAAGFDSIRLPVRWSAHADDAAPYRIDPQFFARVDWAIEQALSRGLAVVLDIHHYAGMDEKPDANRAKFLAIWEQISTRYQDRPAALAFELLNEPHDNLTAAKWNAILAEALQVVRRANPTRQVVIGPVAWNGISELKSLVLPEDDRNLVVTVHYYSPFPFTHQGATWVDEKSRSPLGTQWTGTPEECKAITDDLDTAIIWAVRHRRPIYLGEFGAFEKADLASRARWTQFVADEATKRRIGWAYWEFCAGFGVYDREQRQWIAPLRDALIPPATK